VESLTFSEKIFILGVNPYVRPPDSVLAAIFVQAGRDTSPIPICGTINGAAFRQSLVRYQGDWRLYVNVVMAKVAKLPFSKSVTEIVGQRAEFSISFDPSPREYVLSPLLQRALDAHPRARHNWEHLTPGRQKEILKYFSSLKSDEARERNLTKILKMLGGEVGRFMGREWKNGK
jgi:hypothetical protein